MTTFRRRVQSRPIRLFLIGMLAVPLASLLALWGFAASITVGTALTDADYSSNTQNTNAGVYALIAELPQERQDTYLWLLTGQSSDRTALLGARALVDRAVPPARAALLAGQGANTSVLDALIADLGQLGAIRGSVDSRAMTPSAAFQAYSGIIDAEFHYFLTDAYQRGSASLVAISVGAVDGAYALEMAGREAALINGDPAAVRRQRGATAPAAGRDPGPGHSRAVRQLRQRLAGVPAVRVHGVADPGQLG
jgi:hypothetical protein